MAKVRALRALELRYFGHLGSARRQGAVARRLPLGLGRLTASST